MKALERRPEDERSINIVIAENLVKYVDETDLSLSQLKTLAGFDVARINKLHQNKVDITASKLQEIAFALGVSTIDLVEDWGEDECV